MSWNSESLKSLAVAAAGDFTAAATDFSQNPLELSFDLKIRVISNSKMVILKISFFSNFGTVIYAPYCKPRIERSCPFDKLTSFFALDNSRAQSILIWSVIILSKKHASIIRKFIITFGASKFYQKI